jgi:hypothetical protein
MTLRITGVLDFAHRPEFEMLENTSFRKLGFFFSEMLCCLVFEIPEDGQSPEPLQF